MEALLQKATKFFGRTEQFRLLPRLTLPTFMFQKGAPH